MKQLVIVLLLLHVTTAQLVWKLLNSGNETLAPPARRDAGLGFDSARNRLILFGGRDGEDKILDDTWIYELSSAKWRQVGADTYPSARYGFVSGFSGDSFYATTGVGLSQKTVNDIWKFDMVTEKWTPMPVRQTSSSVQTVADTEASFKPSKRYGAAGGIFPNSSRFYVSHGYNNDLFSDTFTYSITDEAWFEEFPNEHPFSPAYPHARQSHSGAMLSEDTLVIYGGCLTGGGSGGPCPSADTWMFDAQRKEWTELQRCATPRLFASMARLSPRDGETRMILYGGQEETTQVIAHKKYPDDEVAVLNPYLKSWELRKSEGDVPSKRWSAAMASGLRGAYMFGGFSGNGVRNDLYILEGDSIDANNAPKYAGCDQTFFNFIVLHGILMTLGWGFFLQWGAFIARYLRHKDPLWYNLHVLFQIFGLLCALAGLICAIISSTVVPQHFQFSHAIIGLVVMIIGILQPIVASCRPKKPHLGEMRSVRRVIWRLLHVAAGRGALVFALVNISTGVFLAVSAQLIWALWFGYLCFLVLVYFMAETHKSLKDSSNIQDLVEKLHQVGHLNQSGSGGYDNLAMDDKDTG